MSDPQALGQFLKDRRARLDPEALGYGTQRRRTPGLRREEVAARANISPTWYTWLEQGRGGAPSTQVLEQIARALMLTDLERDHLFLLAVRHLPEVRYHEDKGVTPRLQRVLDALEPCPALIRTATWDVVAWNRGVAVMMTDYGALPPSERNILRAMFLDPRARAAQYDWESVARFVVGAFRVDATRAGAARDIEPMVEDLRRLSPEFAAMWSASDDLAGHHEGVKQIRHPLLGALSFEFSAFAVDGRPDLSMVIYNPTEHADMARIAALIAQPSAKIPEEPLVAL